jgi:hypothetical protein
LILVHADAADYVPGRRHEHQLAFPARDLRWLVGNREST